MCGAFAGAVADSPSERDAADFTQGGTGAGAALIDPSIITAQKQLYMDIDVDHGASYGKTIFWDSTAQVPPYLRLANVQFDIDAEKFYKLYIDLMTRLPR